MRTFLGVLLAAVLLAGCGEGGGGGAGAGQEGSDAVREPQLLTMFSQSAVGGSVSPRAVPLDSDEAVQEFADGFRRGRMAGAVRQVLSVLEVPEGTVPAGAVVAIACESPETADIEVTDEGVLVTSPPVDTDRQCLVPITTVAVIAADPDDLSAG